MICFIFGVTTAILTGEELFLLNALLQTFSFQVKSVNTREYRHCWTFQQLTANTQRRETSLHFGDNLETIWNCIWNKEEKVQI